MSAVIAILIRSPSDPRLKARIAPVVPDADQRRELVLSFLDDLVDRVSDIPDVALRVAVTPPLEGLRLARPALAWNQLLLQRGVTFGDRLRHVFDDLAAAGFHHIVVVGADVPDLPPTALTEALRLLRADASAVVTGSSGDGSFYLLGLSAHEHAVPDVFSTVRWGTPHMLEDVEAAVVAHGRPAVRTSDWRDVDTPEDVRELASRLHLAPETARHTAAALEAIDIVGAL
jgi:glycosyltransferase A (GT-A) superfamily protein (DUF2064 family)